MIVAFVLARYSQALLAAFCCRSNVNLAFRNPQSL